MVSSALDELIRISRAVGADPDLVQGGGGNTSVKTRDGRRIFVKASGTALGAMDRRRGWAELDLERLRRILGREELGGLPSRERESEVLRLLAAAVVRPRGARPSVESSLHALLDRVVIHTHPVGLNSFLCSRRSRELYLEVVGDREGEPLYVPYVDPGYVLAARVEREIAAYRGRLGRLPAVVLLENHGLFVAAPGVEECLALSSAVTGIGRKFIGGARVNPPEFPALVSPRGRGRAAFPWAARVRGALLRGGAAPMLVRRDLSSLAGRLLADRVALRSAEEGAFTPDQIVYCRTHPLFLPPRGAPRNGAATGWARASAAAVGAYRRRFGLDPRVVVVPGDGVYYAAPDLGQLRIVLEVYRSAMAAILGSRRAGGPRFLERAQARFIEGWEVEAFRARLAAGAGRPFLGRVAVVDGATGAAGRAAARELIERGAVVLALDRDGRALEQLARDLGPACLPLRIARPAGASVARAFGILEASVGGLDVLIEAGRDGPRLEVVAEAARLFSAQGAGGAVYIGVDGPARAVLQTLAGPAARRGRPERAAGG